MPVIEVDGVSHAYGDRPVLRDVSVSLSERRVAIIGANGSGKSTFARLLNGLVIPDKGRVRVDGLDTRADGPGVRQRVGFVFTDPDAQIVMPTVAEDVAFSLRRHKLSRAETDRAVAEQLDFFGLSQHADHPAHLLSGGQKQLLALCSILVTEPKILVCDEPTTLLDLHNGRHVAGLLAGLPQRIVLVTHDLETVLTYERVLVFEAGAIVFDGPPDAAVAHYRTLSP